MKNIIIIGSGFHAKVVMDEILRKKEYKILGFVDINKKKGTKVNTSPQFKILGDLDYLKRKKNFEAILAIGSNHKRLKIYNQIKVAKIKIKWATIISKDSIISKNVNLGQGSMIISGSIINRNVKIGKHCIINTGSIIEHDNELMDFSSTAPGAKLGGNVKIGKLSFVGLGSCIKQNIKVGENTVIGGNSFVNKNCIKNYTYFGNPAKKYKPRKKNQSYL
tara:strand:+ start:399 stop:1058 length:660 start_codon:yes stop_codon:yes gene_type:complete